MVDHKSGTYRPRRALIEPDVEPARPERPAQPGHNGTGHNGTGHNGNGNGNGHGNGRGVPGAVEGRASGGSARTLRPEAVDGRPSASSPRTPLTPPLDEDHPKPLYREDAPFNRSSRLTSRTARIPADPPTQETLMTPANLAPRRPPSTDDETTTILPRSRPTKSLTQALDAIDDYDDDERRTLGRGAKLALMIGAVAAVVVIGLLIGYAVRGAVNDPPNQPSLSPPSGGGASNGGNQPPGQIGGAVLTDASMLNPRQAKTLDRSRTWKVVTTPQGATDNGPTAACFGGEPLEGQPTPQQEEVRVLKGGKDFPVALHAATAYNSPEEASQAYMIASRTLGGCGVPGYWIKSGHAVSGIGNQAAGVVIMQRDGKGWRAHSVVLNLTGRVVNVLDAAQPSRAIAIDAVARALGQINKVQCTTAGGECGESPTVRKGPPPLGGDEPGFLALGDVPPAGPKVYPWIATEVHTLKEFPGSGCELVNWTTEPAKSKTVRDYLIQESGKDFFGLNEIMLTTKNARAANKFVGRLKSNLSKCKSSQLTARVTNLEKVTSVGVKKTKIAGWTAVVTQKSTNGWVKYRVGIVSAGSKVIYTFLNPSAEYDFTNRQWEIVAVRAGERATQV